MSFKNKIEPHGMYCPDGYVYVHGHTEGSGIYVKPFCRKLPQKRLKISMDMRYPGDTKIKATATQGLRHKHASFTVPTETILDEIPGGDDSFRELMKEDWNDNSHSTKRLENKKR
jgi:hypothetical protein